MAGCMARIHDAMTRYVVLAAGESTVMFACKACEPPVTVVRTPIANLADILVMIINHERKSHDNDLDTPQIPE